MEEEGFDSVAVNAIAEMVKVEMHMRLLRMGNYPEVTESIQQEIHVLAYLLDILIGEDA